MQLRRHKNIWAIPVRHPKQLNPICQTLSPFMNMKNLLIFYFLSHRTVGKLRKPQPIYRYPQTVRIMLQPMYQKILYFKVKLIMIFFIYLTSDAVYQFVTYHYNMS